MHILSLSSRKTKQNMQQWEQGQSMAPSWRLWAGDRQRSHCKSLHSSGVRAISLWQRARALIATSIQSVMISKAQTKSLDWSVANTCPHIPDLDVLGGSRRKCTTKMALWVGRFDSVSCGVTKVDSVTPGLEGLDVFTTSAVNWVSPDQFYCKRRFLPFMKCDSKFFFFLKEQ